MVLPASPSYSPTNSLPVLPLLPSQIPIDTHSSRALERVNSTREGGNNHPEIPLPSTASPQSPLDRRGAAAARGRMAPEAEAESPVVIHAWSAPRSLSTSLMYSFAQVGPPPSSSSLLSCSVRASTHSRGREMGDHKRTGTRSGARAFAQLQRRRVLGAPTDEGLW